MIELGFDMVLCGLIVAVALSAVLARELLAAVVLFVVYGLLAAIAWVRLDSVDVALAEAAIGAGLTGLLLVGAAARLKHRAGGQLALPGTLRPSLLLATQLLVCIAFGWLLIALAWKLAHGETGLQAIVAQNLAASGVSNPVTAVLLNFRAYDTLLECVVLVVALIGVWSLTPDRFWGGVPGPKLHARPDGVLAYFGRLLPLVGIVVGVYLLWAGTHAPGGAFQAGTVLAAVWLLIAMAGLVDAPPATDTRIRLLLVAGPVFFLSLGSVAAAAGTFLAYPAGWEKASILAVETLLTLSIAVTLILLVLGVPRRMS
jgi:multisubunit Na+/H+ antiporter MnhB subunit